MGQEEEEQCDRWDMARSSCLESLFKEALCKPILETAENSLMRPMKTKSSVTYSTF
jgi:hypothetical protein